MRFHEIASGLRVPVSSEEQDILSRAADSGIDAASLDERAQEVARLMVSRGLLDADSTDEPPKHFTVNSVKNVWRDPW